MAQQPSDFFDLVKRFNLNNQTERLMGFVLTGADWQQKSEAARIIVNTVGTQPLEKILNLTSNDANNDQKRQVLKRFWFN
ncbi:MAG: hypothetical protein HC817_10855 [Saprospiraceae bacterium]|nr:hypothetical protein [Saprospiraceae bacterium]